MANTTNFGWETPDDTDLVKDGAASIRTLAGAIDTSLVDLKGGTTGQVLSKATNTDMDFTWVAQDDSNAIQNAIVDAKGDLIAASAADTPARLAVGTNGQVLTADSTEATGLKWVTSSSGGMTLLSTTSCSGSTVTVSSISQSYNSLEIWIYGLTWGTANNVVWFYPYDGNTFETDAIYNTSSTGVATIQNNGLKITPAGDGTRTGGLNCWTITIDNYASSSNRKPISFYGGYNDGVPVFGHGLLTTNSALSSFVLATNSGYTFDGGTIKVYGVK